jgi:hypothetical protein
VFAPARICSEANQGSGKRGLGTGGGIGYGDDILTGLVISWDASRETTSMKASGLGRVAWGLLLLGSAASCSQADRERAPNAAQSDLLDNESAENESADNESADNESVEQSPSNPIEEESRTAFPAELVGAGLLAQPVELPVGVLGPEFLVVSNAEELARVRSALYGEALAADPEHVPVIDFSTEVVVFAYLGRQPSIWRYIGRVAAWSAGEQIEVEFTVESPDECSAAAAESYPYALARVERSDLPYEFLVTDDVADCD